MGKALVQTEESEIVMPNNENQLLLNELMSSLDEEKKDAAAPAKEEAKEEKKEAAPAKEGAKAAAPAAKAGEEDCIPLDDDEKKGAEKEYNSVRAAEKAERAQEKAELEHKSSTAEAVRSKAYWDHMNEGLKVISSMKDGVQKANELAYGNRGIEVSKNEVKNAEASAAKDKEEAAELQKIWNEKWSSILIRLW